jgi:methylated-DNA-[protein]-cysteine S-methyltransferase
MQAIVTEVDSPVGRLQIVTRSDKLCALEFVERARRVASGHAERVVQMADDDSTGSSRESKELDSRSTIDNVVRRLHAYFAGDLRALDEIPVDPTGTAFQRKVWQALRNIPVGHTVSYSELAENIGSPKAIRAVGTANARNPIAIVLPCHRVIGANGSLTGYGGGLDRKRWLLQHEGATTPELLSI